MKTKVGVTIQNSTLKWARESIGFSVAEVAEKTKIAKAEIEKWESEASLIPISSLKKIAKLYKRPLAVFFLKSPPEKDIVPPDFRTLDSVKIETLSRDVRLAIRRAQRNRKFLANLLNETNQPKTKLVDVAFSENPTLVAQKFRNLFKISFEDQVGWESEYIAFYTWVDSVEKMGIPIFHMELPLEEFRGFCLRGNDLPPAIVLNRKDRVRGRIFTLFHEFYHLHLKEDDIQKLIHSQGVAKAHKLIEMKANEFAGAFLVPAGSLLNHQLTKKYIETRDDSLITRIKNIFKVSDEVIYRRLVVHGILSEEQYKIKHRELLKFYEQEAIKKRKKMQESNKPFIPNHSLEIANNVGFVLGNKAFEAAREGKISTFELVSFLDAKVSYLDKVRKQIDQHYSYKHAN